MADELNEDDIDVNPFKISKNAGKTNIITGNFTAYKVIKQLVLIGIWAAMGVMLSMQGPAMPDLTVTLGLNYEELSRALFGTGVGSLTGGIIGGIICERFYSKTDLFMSLTYIVGAAAFALVPWMPGLWSLFTIACIVGIALGLMNAGGNTMVMHLWSQKSGPPMYSLHFSYGLGGVIGPQIAKPFLASHNNVMNVHIVNNNSTWGHSLNESILIDNGTSTPHPDFDKSDSQIFIPFGIAGILNTFFALLLLILFLKGEPRGFPRRDHSSTAKQVFSPKTCATGNPLYGTGILILLFFYFFTAVGQEVSYERFLFAFATESDLGFDTYKAATLTSLFWLCHTGGRAVGIVISRFIPIYLIIFSNISLLLVVSVLLVVLAHVFPIALWVLTGVCGFLCSSFFPCGMLWSNNYLSVNSMSVMVCLVGAALGASCYSYVVGYMFEYHGPRTVMYVQVFACAALLVLFILMELLGRRYKKIKLLREELKFKNTLQET